MEDILIPLGICVALPVLIVWLVNRTRQNETNRKTEIALKAIESGATIDANFFKSTNGEKTIKERLLKRLTGACIFTLMGIAFFITGLINRSLVDVVATSKDDIVFPLMGVLLGIFLAIGISLFIVFFVGRKMLAKEIEAEEKSLSQN